MASRTHEIPINGHTFYIHRYPPFLALEIMGDLQNKFAGPFISVLDGKPAGSETETTKAMMEAFGKLSASINGKELRALAEKLMVYSEDRPGSKSPYISVAVNGENPRPLDAGAVGLTLETAADILQLCWSIIQHNFSEVLARLNSPFIQGVGSPNQNR